MDNFEAELTGDLVEIREKGLYRQLSRMDSPQGPRIHIGGKQLHNFSSNDYLGLANHPFLKEAAARAIDTYGVSAGASRLVCGSFAPHHELEEALAQFKSREAALSFSTGYATALATICALVGKDDVIIVDRLVHACVIDAAKLSGAKLRVFAHNDLEALDHVLSRIRTRSGDSSAKKVQRILIVTESVFSMDGDRAPLCDLVELKDKYGAWLMLDEAHATGVLGPSGRGWAEAQGVNHRIDVQMGTLGKAVGAAGGYICGTRALVDLLINRGRSFIFSTAPMPAGAAAASAGLQLLQSKTGDQLRSQLWERIRQVHEGLGQLHCDNRDAHDKEEGPDLDTGPSNPPVRSGLKDPASAILPIMVGDEGKSMQLARALREHGFFVPAIRYPTVAHGQARLRLTVTSAHEADPVRSLLSTLKALGV